MRRISTPVAARIVLVLAFATCAIGMIGPFQGVEEALIPWDKAAHFIAFYALTCLLLVAYPTRRRFDLALLAVMAGAGIEVAQRVFGRDAGVGDVLANAAGAAAVLLPVHVEGWRAQARGEGRVERRKTQARLAAASGALQPQAAPAPSRS